MTKSHNFLNSKKHKFTVKNPPNSAFTITVISVSKKVIYKGEEEEGGRREGGRGRGEGRGGRGREEGGWREGEGGREEGKKGEGGRGREEGGGVMGEGGTRDSKLSRSTLSR